MAELIQIGGCSGAGKSTLCERLVASCEDLVYIRPAEWPALKAFLVDPMKHAFESQMQAMEVALQALVVARDSDARWAVMDFTPNRVFFVYTRLYQQMGWIDSSKADEIRKRMTDVTETVSPPLLLLDLPHHIAQSRVRARRRYDGSTFGISLIGRESVLWREFARDYTTCAVTSSIDGRLSPVELERRFWIFMRERVGIK